MCLDEQPPARRNSGNNQRQGRAIFCHNNERLQMPTWTSIDKALPDDDETVLIFAEECDPPVWLGYIEAGVWYSADAWQTRVTHWMPMPEAPEGVS
jgi:hypothetical protein